MWYTTSKNLDRPLFTSIFDELFEGEKTLGTLSTKSRYGYYEYRTESGETGTDILVNIPAMNREKLSVKVVDGNKLLIEYTPETKDDVFGKGQFTQKYSLSGIDIEKVTSEYRDGVLKVHLPKVEKSIPKNIDVKFI